MSKHQGRTRQRLEALRASFWFLPGVMVLAAIVLASTLVEIDTRIGSLLREQWPGFFGVGADGSRGLLSAIGSSMITVAGVIFSITIVTLSLASSQYTPRILRNFMRDRANQLVLGVFVAVYVYCLVVLRTIRAGDNEFVPSLAVIVGILLAIVNIGFLIFFIHHVASSIQASRIIEGASSETLHAIEHLFPEPVGEEGDEPDLSQDPKLPNASWRLVRAARHGYLQNVEPDDLLDFAAGRNVVVRIEATVGDFVVKDGPLVSVLSQHPLSDGDQRKLRSLFTLSSQRSIEQDAAFGVRQIVDTALKALSPGINDTTTADICVDHLTNILSQLAQRHIESPFRQRDGAVRAITRGPTFDSLVTESFEQIRQNAGGNVRVLCHLVSAIETVASFTSSKKRREALRRHLPLIEEVMQRTILNEDDRTRALTYCRTVQQRLSGDRESGE